MITRILCKFAGHQRSIASARRTDGVWRSRCKRCGAEIVRVRATKWRRKVDLLALREELLRHLDHRYGIIDPRRADR